MNSPLSYKTKAQLKIIPLVLSYYNFEDFNKENDNYFLKPENISKYFNVPCKHCKSRKTLNLMYFI